MGRAKAYGKGISVLGGIKVPITLISQVKGLPGIGKGIMKKV